MTAPSDHAEWERQRAGTNRRLALLLGAVALGFFAATMLLSMN